MRSMNFRRPLPLHRTGDNKPTQMKIAEPPVKKSGRRPGRDPDRATGDTKARDTILDVAERLFAENGYAGTSLRDISEGADVNQALIPYYFESKKGLFEAVFKRRGFEVVEARMRLLDDLESRKKAPTVREIIEAYLRPQFDMKRSGPSGHNFVRLQARLHNEPKEFAFRLRRLVYDVSTKRYIAALERALPSVDPAEVNFRMMFLIGVYLYMLSDVARLDELSDKRFSARDMDEVLARMMTFLVAGMRAKNTDFSLAARRDLRAAGQASEQQGH